MYEVVDWSYMAQDKGQWLTLYEHFNGLYNSIKWCDGCSRRWGESVSLNCDHRQSCCSSPRFMKTILGVMIITGENQRTRRKNSSSATLPIKNSTCPPGSEPRPPRWDRRVTAWAMPRTLMTLTSWAAVSFSVRTSLHRVAISLAYHVRTPPTERNLRRFVLKSVRMLFGT
jgi:hypothetical protein